MSLGRYENGAVISSNVLKHDVPPILEGSTDGIVAKSCVSKRHPCHSYTIDNRTYVGSIIYGYTQGLAMLHNFCVVG